MEGGGGGSFVPEGPAEEGLGVLDGMQGVAEVDKVVFVVGVDPFFLEVVDEEVDVFGDISGLDGGQIDAGYRGVWVLVANWSC